MKQSTKTTLRTIIQAVVGLAAAMPLLVEASGVPESLPGVGVALAVAAGLARVMALPVVQELLDRIGLGTAAPDVEAVMASPPPPPVVLRLDGVVDAELVRLLREAIRRGGDG